MRELLGESAAQVVDINTFIASIGDVMQQISANAEVTRATEVSVRHRDKRDCAARGIRIAAAAPGVAPDL